MWEKLLLCACGISCVILAAAAPHNLASPADPDDQPSRAKRAVSAFGSPANPDDQPARAKRAVSAFGSPANPDDQPARAKRAVPAFVATAAKDVGAKVVSALGDRIAEGVVENHREKIVSKLEDYLGGAFDKADAEFDEVLARSGGLLAGVQDIEEATVKVLHGRGGNTGDTFSPPSEEVRMQFKHKEDNAEQDSSELGAARGYPFGLGPIMMNGCFGNNYQKGDPCYEAFIPIEVCETIIDGGTFLGVGYDGRGEYSADSRRKSLVQRHCQGLQTYKGYHVPDQMTVQGIYDTDVESYTFLSAEEYRTYLEEKSAVTAATGMFEQEMKKATGHGAASFGFGLIASGGGGKTSSGGTDSQTSNTEANSDASAELSETNTQTFIAMLELNVFRYEIFLDFVGPEDLNLGFLRDFLTLPTSYFVVGADRQYQNFILRWGTHYITSATFGGQLKIIKTKENTEEISKESFAMAAQSDFKKVFSTYSAQQTQTKSSSLWHDHETKNEKQSSTGESTQDTSSETSTEEMTSRNRMEFSSESITAQGGDQAIGAAITELYTTNIGSSLKDWLESINDFPKPFEFTMQELYNLVDMNFDALFPSGVTDYGCFGREAATSHVPFYRTLQTEAGTDRKYYTQEVSQGNGTRFTTEVRYCDFATQDELREGLTNRRLALKRATTVYLEEGKLFSSHFAVPAGEPGCETSELVFLQGSNSLAPSWEYMTSGKEFTVIFDMPGRIPNLVAAQASLDVKYVFDTWLTVRKGRRPRLYDGYSNGNSGDITTKKISVGGLVMTYREASGLLVVTSEDYDASAAAIADLPDWLNGRVVARVEHKSLLEQLSNMPVGTTRGAVPCNLKWYNNHRIDPTTDGGKCIHFTAASAGNMFVVFSGVPSKQETWLYLQISPDAVAVYKSMRLAVTQFDQGATGLGSDNLYQSYFVCVTEDVQAGTTVVQYGKMPDNKEQAHVWLDYRLDGILSVRYYAFGSGEHRVKFTDVSQVGLPRAEFLVCREGTEKSGGRCRQVCHQECEGCKTTGSDDPRDCLACVNKTVPYPYINGTRGDFECVPDCPLEMVAPSGSSTCECIRRMEDVTADGVVTCVADCPLTHYDDNNVCRRCSSFCEDVSGYGTPVCTGPDVDHCHSCLYREPDGSCVPGCSPGQKAVEASANGGGDVPADCHWEGVAPLCDTSTSCARGAYVRSDNCGDGDCCWLGNKIYCCDGIRLVDGNGPHEGRVEVYHDDQWGTICDDSWDTNDAEVVCRHLGWQGAEEAPQQAHFGEGADPIWLDDLQCTGSEASLADCPNSGWGTHNCNHYEDASVVCTSGVAGSFTCEPCRPGYRCVNGDQVEEICPAGTYSNVGGTACDRCPAGEYSNEGSASCTPCPAGQYSYPGFSCFKCPVGWYSPGTGQTCQRCPANTYSSTQGSTSCQPCPSGSSSDAGSTTCTACYWEGTAPFCDPDGCDRGNYVRSSNSGDGESCWSGSKIYCCYQTP